MMFSPQVFRERCVIRLQHLNYENKCLKLFFWLLLMSYTPISSKLLRLFKCSEVDFFFGVHSQSFIPISPSTQVGGTMYLTVDFTITCDAGGTWGMYVIFAGIPATIVFIIGIPVLFLSCVPVCHSRRCSCAVAHTGYQPTRSAIAID